MVGKMITTRNGKIITMLQCIFLTILLSSTILFFISFSRLSSVEMTESSPFKIKVDESKIQRQVASETISDIETTFPFNRSYISIDTPLIFPISNGEYIDISIYIDGGFKRENDILVTDDPISPEWSIHTLLSKDLLLCVGYLYDNALHHVCSVLVENRLKKQNQISLVLTRSFISLKLNNELIIDSSIQKFDKLYTSIPQSVLKTITPKTTPIEKKYALEDTSKLVFQNEKFQGINREIINTRRSILLYTRVGPLHLSIRSGGARHQFDIIKDNDEIKVKINNELTINLSSLSYHDPLVNHMTRKSDLINNPPNLLPVEKVLFSSSKNSSFTTRSNFYGGIAKDVYREFDFAYSGYEKYAWKHDDLKPISKAPSNWVSSGITIIDSLSTIWLMGDVKRWQTARQFVSQDLKWLNDESALTSRGQYSFFESVIRFLGGLLSAYSLSGDDIFLKRAQGLGYRLLPGLYYSPNGPPRFPAETIDIGSKRPGGSSGYLSEFSTMQIEFKRLSVATKNSVFERAADGILLHFLENQDPFINLYATGPYYSIGSMTSGTVSLGARADSFYEYLLKYGIMLENGHNIYLEKWLKSVNSIIDNLVKKTNDNFLYIADGLFEVNHSHQKFKIIDHKMDHLACFYGGNLGLSYLYTGNEKFLKYAKLITESCVEYYRKSLPILLAPEYFDFGRRQGPHQKDLKHLYKIPSDAQFNLLRPETLESLFYLYVITGDNKYRDYSIEIFNAFKKWAKVEGVSYSSINFVGDTVTFRDSLESFFFAETLKYMFLIHLDRSVLLDLLTNFVFNTEGHPM